MPYSQEDLMSLMFLSQHADWQYKLEAFTDQELIHMQAAVDQAKGEISSYVRAKGSGITNWQDRHSSEVIGEFNRLTSGIQGKLTEDIEEVAAYIGARSIDTYNDILSYGGRIVKFTPVAMSGVQLRSMIRDTPIGGNTLHEWVGRTFGHYQEELQHEVTVGALKGEGYAKLVKRLESTFDELSETEVVTLARTYVQSVNTNAMDMLYEANSDIVKRVKWTATLEPGYKGRGTCPRCAGLDGNEYALNQHPPIPLHPRCRCVLIPITVTFKELGIDFDEIQEIARPFTMRPDKNIGKGGRKILDVGFHRGGDYSSFFDQQSNDFQLKMLGPRRFELYDSRIAAFKDFTDPQTGRFFNLAELADRGIRLPNGVAAQVAVDLEPSQLAVFLRAKDVPHKNLPYSKLAFKETEGLPYFRGTPILYEDPRIPETLYHVTTNKPAIIKSGKLKASGEGGLGGDAVERVVCFTTDSVSAKNIKEDLRLVVEMAQYKGTDIAISEQVIARLQKQSIDEGWDFLKHWGYPEESFTYLKSSYTPHDWSTQYFVARQTAIGKTNPIIFTNDDILKQIKLKDIQILEVPRSRLKTGGLICDYDIGDTTYGLSECRIYSDVDITNLPWSIKADPMPVSKLRGVAAKIPDKLGDEFPSDFAKITTAMKNKQANWDDIREQMKRELDILKRKSVEHKIVQGELTKDSLKVIKQNMKNELTLYNRYLAGDTMELMRDYIDDTVDLLIDNLDEFVVKGLALKKVSKEAEALLKKVKKYDNVDDFIESQGIQAFHGSDKKFEIFDIAKSKSEGMGIWFLDDPYLAKRQYGSKGFKDVRLNLKNPYTVEYHGKDKTTKSVRGIIATAKEKGHDSVILKDVLDQPFYDPMTYDVAQTQYFVFSVDQIKTKEQLITIWNKVNKLETQLLPVYRGVGPKGLAGMKQKATFYTRPQDAAAYSKKGGGVLVGYVDPDKVKLIDNMVVIKNTDDFYRLGVISDGKTKNLGALNDEVTKILPIAMKSEDLDYMLIDSIKKLVFQEIESNRQQFTDHGIRHLVKNVKMQNKILDTFVIQGMNVTARERLLGRFIMVNHDIGYATPLVRKGGFRGILASGDHPLYSTKIAFEQKRLWDIGKVFTEHEYHRALRIIRTHDSTSTSIYDVLALSTRLSDNMSLFQAEKLSGMFRYIPQGRQKLLAMAKAAKKGDKKTFNKLRDYVYKKIDAAQGLSGNLKRDLKAGISEMSLMSPKFTLGVLGGEVTQVKAGVDALVHVVVKYNEIDTVLQKVFDMGQYQTRKLLKDYGITAFDKNTYLIGKIGDKYALRLTIKDAPKKLLVKGSEVGEELVSSKIQKLKLPVSTVTEYDVKFITGEPVTFKYVHNTQKSPYMGKLYQQDIEPSGKYIQHVSDDAFKTRNIPDNFEKGVITFNNPLVIKFNSVWREGYDEHSWKAVLAKKYKKKGKKLTKAITDEGFDGIVTVNVGKNGEALYTAEIIDLKRTLSAQGTLKITPIEISREASITTIQEGFAGRKGNWLSGWFRNADKDYKPKIIRELDENPKLHNAALNIFHTEYQIGTGKKIPFKKFMDSDITVYRYGKIPKDKSFVSFSYDKKMAQKFEGVGRTLTEITIKPRDTYGMLQTIAEGEVLVPSKLITKGVAAKIKKSIVISDKAYIVTTKKQLKELDDYARSYSKLVGGQNIKQIEDGWSFKFKLGGTGHYSTVEILKVVEKKGHTWKHIKMEKVIKKETVLLKKEPWEMTTKEFVDFHKTGNIADDVYRRDTVEEYSKFYKIEHYPIVHSKHKFAGSVVEFRQEKKELLKYVKHTDEAITLPSGKIIHPEIMRDAKGEIVFLSAKEITKKGLLKYDLGITAFYKGKPIGFASDEWGSTGIWVAEKYQGKGIGVKLLEEFRKQLPPRYDKIGQMTTAGTNLTKAYHRRLVIQAIEDGKQVPNKIAEKALKESAASKKKILQKIKQQEELIIYRGVGPTSPTGGPYYSTDKDFALQFTQTAREEEILTAYISKSDVYKRNPLPFASDIDDLDKAIIEAKEKGFSALLVDEGARQPNSVFILNRRSLRATGSQAKVKANLSDYQLRAIKHAVPVTKEKNALGKASEMQIAKMIKGDQILGNKPFDVFIDKEFIEVKTILSGRGQVRIEPAQRARKNAFAKKYGVRMHTMLVDKRPGSITYGKMFYRKGIGDFKPETMIGVADENHLRRLLNKGRQHTLPPVEAISKVPPSPNNFAAQNYARGTYTAEAYFDEPGVHKSVGAFLNKYLKAASEELGVQPKSVRFGSIEFAGKNVNVAALATEQGHIILNKKFFVHEKYLADIIERSFNINGFSTNSAGHILRHEMGHLKYFQLGGTEKTSIRQLSKKHVLELRKNVGVQNIRKYMSGYGMTSEGEFYAEAMAQVLNGQRLHPVVNKIVKDIEKGLNKNLLNKLSDSNKSMVFHQAKFGEGGTHRVATFLNSRSKMKTIHKPFVTAYSEQEYKKMGAKVYLSADKKSGYALTPDGDLISVFSLNHNGRPILESAIAEGARTLDCFDGFLPDLYTQFGFKEYKRLTWSDEYAPKGWDYIKNGRPDIVFMKLERGVGARPFYWTDEIKSVREAQKKFAGVLNSTTTTVHEFIDEQKAIDAVINTSNHMADVFNRFPKLEKIVDDTSDFGAELSRLAIVNVPGWKMDGRSGILGYYERKTRSISVAIKNMSLSDELHLGRKHFGTGRDYFSNVRHEYGHHIHKQFLTTKQKDDWFSLYLDSGGSSFFEGYVSKYAGSDMDEAFAEAFSAYTSPLYETLKASNVYVALPRKVERFFDDLIGNVVDVNKKELAWEKVLLKKEKQAVKAIKELDVSRGEKMSTIGEVNLSKAVSKSKLDNTVVAYDVIEDIGNIYPIKSEYDFLDIEAITEQLLTKNLHDAPKTLRTYTNPTGKKLPLQLTTRFKETKYKNREFISLSKLPDDVTINTYKDLLSKGDTEVLGIIEMQFNTGDNAILMAEITKEGVIKESILIGQRNDFEVIGYRNGFVRHVDKENNIIVKHAVKIICKYIGKGR